ncbi:MAG TPA: DUF1844 domain-containing protein [Thermoanaerobaculia bacterium]|nr:DUF1844 domain-containing protein [Thermoanaerobaculia bacterium]
MPKEKKSHEPIKVTDKRIFTSEGDIREEFRTSVTPVDPLVQKPTVAPEVPAPTPPPEPPKAEKKKLRDKATDPGTLFSNLVGSLASNAYMSLGIMRNPYGSNIDLEGAHQMIEILVMLGEKTKGNLTEEESDFLTALVGELKLAYVQVGKGIPK